MGGSIFGTGNVQESLRKLTLNKAKKLFKGLCQRDTGAIIGKAKMTDTKPSLGNY
jgi:hypothetical protein